MSDRSGCRRGRLRRGRAVYGPGFATANVVCTVSTPRVAESTTSPFGARPVTGKVALVWPLATVAEPSTDAAGSLTERLSLTDDVFLRFYNRARWQLGIPLPVE
jgi:hypothetical protein